MKKDYDIIKSIISEVITYHNKKEVLNRQRKVQHIYSKNRILLAKLFLKNKLLFYIINFFYVIYLLIKNLKIKKNNNNSKTDILFLCKTINQFHSLKPYYEILNSYNKAFLQTRNFGFEINLEKVNLYLNITDIIFLLRIYFRYLKYISANCLIKNELYAFDFFLIPIYFYFFKKILKENKVKYLFISSEQDIERFILKDLCKLLNIKIYYVQHAHIGNGENSLPLEYDVSFLDSQHVLDIYKKIDPLIKKRNIKLVGIMKYLGKSKPIDFIALKNIHKIGICIGSTFNKSKLINYIKKLKIVNDNIILLIRQHPSKNIEDYIIDNNIFPFEIRYLDSKKYSIFDYVNTIDLNLASVSSVHLDILTLGKISLFFNPLGEENIYPFKNYGLVREITNFNDITQDVLNYYLTKEYKKIIKYFNANYLENPEKIKKEILSVINF